MGLTPEELKEMREMQKRQELAKTPAGRIALKLVEERKEAHRRQEKVFDNVNSALKAPEPLKVEKTDPISEQLEKWGYV